MNHLSPIGKSPLIDAACVFGETVVGLLSRNCSKSSVILNHSTAAGFMRCQSTVVEFVKPITDFVPDIPFVKGTLINETLVAPMGDFETVRNFSGYANICSFESIMTVYNNLLTLAAFVADYLQFLVSYILENSVTSSGVAIIGVSLFMNFICLRIIAKCCQCNFKTQYIILELANTCFAVGALTIAAGLFSVAPTISGGILYGVSKFMISLLSPLFQRHKNEGDNYTICEFIGPDRLKRIAPLAMWAASLGLYGGPGIMITGGFLVLSPIFSFTPVTSIVILSYGMSLLTSLGHWHLDIYSRYRQVESPPIVCHD